MYFFLNGWGYLIGSGRLVICIGLDGMGLDCMIPFSYIYDLYIEYTWGGVF